MAEDYEYIPGRYGYSIERVGPQAVAGRVPMAPDLLDESGALGHAAVLMAVDMTCTMAAGLGVLPDWTVTADVAINVVGSCTIGPLRVDADGLRAGRTMSVVQARVVDEGADDALVGLVTANNGVLASDFAHRIADAGPGDVHSFARPAIGDGSIDAYFGLIAEQGRYSLPIGTRTTNPWGILHGGLLGLLVDRVVRGAAISDVDDIVMRFLRPVRTGPAVASCVDDVTTAMRRVLRVEVTDGVSGRLAAIAHVTGR